ncbi:MAG: hypothetical protein RL398_2441, partial [Planctomycetota bacterium]
YQATKRQAVYPFLVEHLGLDAAGVRDAATGSFDETANRIVPTAELRVFDAAHPAPKHALPPGSAVPMQG